MRKKPADVQPAQALDISPRVEPERKDLPNRTVDVLKMYTFMLTTTPSNAATMVESARLVTASGGMWKASTGEKKRS